ncbi:PAS domain S-box protein [Deinococcus sp. KSM4-11]|uniref:PAS domain S-box protein n=1 Tax=Deinococcus sp. KSM4-11 TaxID=2568654 RepID=UPI0010A53393|nr:PAS domain S-box protein [Deinococcus sp. KSM4-11]THF84375.1 PAS domain S-box protein [Deinococcus sp. KSM4-11]
MNVPLQGVDAALLSRVLDASVSGAVLADARQDDVPLIYVNPTFEHLTGYSAAEVIGRNCRFLQGEDRDQSARHDLRHAIATGQPVTAILRNYRKDGSLFLCEVTLSALRDEDGQVTHVMGFQHDVTAREAARWEASQASQRLLATLNNLPDPFISCDRNRTVTYANAAAAARFGHPPSEIIGQPLAVLSPDAVLTPTSQAAARVLETGVTEHISMHSDLLDLDLEATAYAINDGVAVLMRDVTAERHALQEARESQERFAKVFAASPLAIAVTRLRDGQFIEVNPAFSHLSGYTREEVIGRTSTDLQLWPEPGERTELVSVLQQRGALIDREMVFRVKSGELRDTVTTILPITLAREECMLSMVRDVSQERRAQRQLEASEQAARHAAAELQRTLDQSPDMIVSVDAQGRFLGVSAASERLLGYPPHVMSGRPYLDFVHPDDRPRTVQVVTHPDTLGENGIFQNRYVHRDGSLVWLEWSSVQLLDGVVYGVARDITARRAADEAQAFLAAIVQASPDAIIGLSLDSIIQSWNGGAERMYGYAATEMIGQRITAIVPLELAEEQRALLARAAQGEYSPSIETTRLSREGRGIPVQLSIAPIFDSEGTVVGVSKIAHDISGRREAERQIQQLNITLQRKLEHLTGLHKIDAAITSSPDLYMTLGVVLDEVVAQVEVDAATVQLLDTHAMTLTYAATRGFTAPLPQEPATRLGQGLSGRVALTREPVIVNDLRAAALPAIRQAWADREGFCAYAAVPLSAKGKSLGVLGVFRRQPFDEATDWLATLQILAGQAAIAVENTQLFLGLERSNLELGLAYQETIEGWARALDLRDKETEGHSRRVTEMTVRLCRALGVAGVDLVHVQRGALLHDIGKMGIADAILLKPGPLTEEEWVEMRKHPGYAVELLSPIRFLHPAMDIPQYHHEKWDGSGYPHGLRETAIPLTARAFAIVDVYDALTNDRPYRQAWSRTRALTHLQDQAGRHFDPEIIRTFTAMMQVDG